MSTILSYTVEDIKMIFNELKSNYENRSRYLFTVSIDGVEITPMCDELHHFNDFMLYDLMEAEELLFNFYSTPDQIVSSYKFWMKAKNQWEVYLKDKNERLKKENAQHKAEIKTLKQAVRKLEQKKYYEKIECVKAIDVGDYVVLFVSKSEIQKILGEQLKQARDGVTMLEKVERLFHRFIYQPKK